MQPLPNVTIVAVGDFNQLSPVGSPSMHRKDLNVHKYQLVEQVRCDDPLLRDFLQAILRREATLEQLTTTVRGHHYFPNVPILQDHHIKPSLAATPNTERLFLTCRKQAAHKVNMLAIEKYFANQTPLAIIDCYDVDDPLPIFCGMKMVVTYNQNKRERVLNGTIGYVTNVTE